MMRPSARPDLTNVTTAMRSAYRFPYRRPFLRWALSPDFCATMHPLLIEERSSTFFLGPRWTNFTTCDRIRSVIRDAFAVWAAANPALTFVDVSDRCESERLWRPLTDARCEDKGKTCRCAESPYCIELEKEHVNDTTTVDWWEESTPLEKLPNPAPYLCSHRTCFECDRADVIIGGLGDAKFAARFARDQLKSFYEFDFGDEDDETPGK